MANPRDDGPSALLPRPPVALHPPPFAARYLARRLATHTPSGPPGDRLRWLIVWWRGGRSRTL